MTNPDNVGWLPELPKISPHDHPEPRSMMWSNLEIQWIQRYARAYAELCRAASAGGDSLRALVKELRESLEGVVRVADRNTDEFDRAREAIARASHVFVNAGDSEAQFIADGENLDCPACGGSGHAGDSAPAGSGEVEARDAYSRIIKALAAIACVHTPDDLFDLNAIPRDPVMLQVMRIRQAADDLAALLRKLQQGAE